VALLWYSRARVNLEAAAKGIRLMHVQTPTMLRTGERGRDASHVCSRKRVSIQLSCMARGKLCPRPPALSGRGVVFRLFRYKQRSDTSGNRTIAARGRRGRPKDRLLSFTEREDSSERLGETREHHRGPPPSVERFERPSMCQRRAARVNFSASSLHRRSADQDSSGCVQGRSPSKSTGSDRGLRLSSPQR